MAQYEYGVIPLGDSYLFNTGLGSFALDSNNDQYAIGVVLPQDATIEKFAFYVHAYNGTPPTYQVEVFTADSNGVPNTLITGAQADLSISATGWMSEATIGTPPSLTAGTLYYFVVSVKTGTADGTNNISIRESSRRSHMDGDSNGEESSTWAGNYIRPCVESTDGGTSWASSGRGSATWYIKSNDATPMTWGETSYANNSTTFLGTNLWRGFKFSLPHDFILYGCGIKTAATTSQTPGTVKAYLLSSDGQTVHASGTTDAGIYKIWTQQITKRFYFTSTYTISADTSYIIAFRDPSNDGTNTVRLARSQFTSDATRRLDNMYFRHHMVNSTDTGSGDTPPTTFNDDLTEAPQVDLYGVAAPKRIIYGRSSSMIGR